MGFVGLPGLLPVCGVDFNFILPLTISSFTSNRASSLASSFVIPPAIFCAILFSTICLYSGLASTPDSVPVDEVDEVDEDSVAVVKAGDVGSAGFGDNCGIEPVDVSIEFT